MEWYILISAWLVFLLLVESKSTTGLPESNFFKSLMGGIFCPVILLGFFLVWLVKGFKHDI